MRSSSGAFECKRCGVGVIAKYGDKRRSFCSKRCCKRASNSLRKHLKRTQSRSADRFFAFEIYKRDGFMCLLCGGPLDMDGNPNDPLSPTLDHVIPVTLGGLHVRGNVQSAHRVCNCSKKAIPPVPTCWRLNGGKRITSLHLTA